MGYDDEKDAYLEELEASHEALIRKVEELKDRVVELEERNELLQIQVSEHELFVSSTPY